MDQLDIFGGISIMDEFNFVLRKVDALTQDEKVAFINQMRIAIHSISPFKDEPVDCVLWVKNDRVFANDYNPNSVAPPEMKLLDG